MLMRWRRGLLGCTAIALAGMALGTLFGCGRPTRLPRRALRAARPLVPDPTSQRGGQPTPARESQL